MFGLAAFDFNNRIDFGGKALGMGKKGDESIEVVRLRVCCLGLCLLGYIFEFAVGCSYSRLGVGFADLSVAATWGCWVAPLC
ncbi:hypothetical protein U1Q18_025965 [Sarracenia purpurea var. burkii]